MRVNIGVKCIEEKIIQSYNINRNNSEGVEEAPGAIASGDCGSEVGLKTDWRMAGKRARRESGARAPNGRKQKGEGNEKKRISEGCQQRESGQRNTIVRER